MKTNLEGTVETLSAVYVKGFKIREDLEDKDLYNVPEVPEHFSDGGVFIAIKHVSENEKLYRVFFNKISGKTTIKSFFNEINSAEVAGILIDANNPKDSLWEIDIEEFDFLRTETYRISEKALSVISEIILMDMSEFKELSGEDKYGVEIEDINTADPDGMPSSSKYDVEISKDTERLIGIDRAVSFLQDHIIATLSDKYDNAAIDTKDLIYHDKHGKSINMFNAIKYLTRYLNDDGNKANNPEDLKKAAHYIMFELSRRIIKEGL